MASFSARVQISEPLALRGRTVDVLRGIQTSHASPLSQC
jgi:hypothetical protein